MRRPPESAVAILASPEGMPEPILSMGSTYLSLHYHIVFGTKDLRPLMRPDWRSELHQYLGGTVRGLGGVPEIINGVDDHLHLLVGLRATHCLADFVRELKKASSAWATDHDRLFRWQDGYGAFTVSPTQRESVRNYIRKQEPHHRKLTFAEEYRTFLIKAGIEFDPKYLL